jgi:two-component system, chemotaxis family, chemotaxis protein CheY
MDSGEFAVVANAGVRTEPMFRKREARKQALVVDNSKGLRLLLGWILQEVGIEAVEASDGAEALRILGADELFAVVILDWDLPGMNGIQLVAEIRRHENLKSLRVMMISGRPHSSDAEYALRSGVDDSSSQLHVKGFFMASLGWACSSHRSTCSCNQHRSRDCELA